MLRLFKADETGVKVLQTVDSHSICRLKYSHRKANPTYEKNWMAMWQVMMRESRHRCWRTDEIGIGKIGPGVRRLEQARPSRLWLKMWVSAGSLIRDIDVVDEDCLSLMPHCSYLAATFKGDVDRSSLVTFSQRENYVQRGQAWRLSVICTPQ